ncbi:PorT family protein [Chitinophaga agri]|uniref:PorT family protein n=1 Tax=Chitinophaga agri TaxID=2703787 RepID=A0A6B9ZIA2_9BACT|nr:PorT family protein [Chitinophaga agri]QHS61231.1 PorT family protein [Chitinophaga agri]
MKHKFYLIPSLLCLLQLPVFSQEQKTDTTREVTMTITKTYTSHRRSYTTFGGEGALLSFGRDIRDAGKHVPSIPRFTLFFNIGTNYNYDFNRNFGFFSGINLKNIGLITKDDIDSVKLKRRVYTLGVPLGFKIGDLRRGVYFFAGGSYDLAFNYKEKKFINGDKKEKFNEWFSDRTPLLMPSLFAGLNMAPGFGVKVQYYPNNFFNKEYKETGNSGGAAYPYQQLDAQLIFVSLHCEIRGRYHHEKIKKKTIRYQKNF